MKIVSRILCEETMLSRDFVSDAFACGRRFRIFAVVDDYSRECVRLIADTLISGARVGRELDAAGSERLARPSQGRQ